MKNIHKKINREVTKLVRKVKSKGLYFISRYGIINNIPKHDLLRNLKSRGVTMLPHPCKDVIMLGWWPSIN